MFGIEGIVAENGNGHRPSKRDQPKKPPQPTKPEEDKKPDPGDKKPWEK
ncbi:MAG: hypothetical protein AAB955_03390 [Patescibacteria group bacterium]